MACWFQDTWKKSVMRCHVYFIHSFVYVFIFSKAEWVTLLNCLCSEVKTDVLKFNHWSRGRIQ